MKRIFLTAVIMALGIGIAHAGALTEDYIDIASSYAKDGKYSQALGYINKALALEPQNSRLLEMKNDLSKIMGQPSINWNHPKILYTMHPAYCISARSIVH